VHDERVPLIMNATFGGAGIYGKPEVESVLRSLMAAAERSRVQYQAGENFLLDVYVYISGDVWQHGRSGIQLGNIGRKSRSLWVRIYLPDEVTTRDQAAEYLASALPAAAGLVHSRLRRRAPDWPADDLAAELTGLAAIL
jgi:hypothetical protein